MCVGVCECGWVGVCVECMCRSPLYARVHLLRWFSMSGSSLGDFCTATRSMFAEFRAKCVFFSHDFSCSWCWLILETFMFVIWPEGGGFHIRLAPSLALLFVYFWRLLLLCVRPFCRDPFEWFQEFGILCLLVCFFFNSWLAGRASSVLLFSCFDTQMKTKFFKSRMNFQRRSEAKTCCVYVVGKIEQPQSKDEIG